MGKRWMEDMGLKWRDMPNFVAHSQADEEHSDMFLPFLEEYATGEKQQMALDAVKESLDLFALYRAGATTVLVTAHLSNKVPPFLEARREGPCLFGGSMAGDSNSFDIVSDVDLMEVSNAVQQAMKEIRQRFDFKGSVSDVTLEKEVLTLHSDDGDEVHHHFRGYEIMRLIAALEEALAFGPPIPK